MENKECCCCDPKQILRIIEKILDCKCNNESASCKEHGKVSLTNGKHEIFIKTKNQASKIFLSSSSCHQVCAAQTDLFNAMIVPDGFVLIANIQNDNAKIEWMACSDNECCC